MRGMLFWGNACLGLAAGWGILLWAGLLLKKEQIFLTRGPQRWILFLTCAAFATLPLGGMRGRALALADAAAAFAALHAVTDYASGYIYDRNVLLSLACAAVLRLPFGFWGELSLLVRGLLAGTLPLCCVVLLTRGGMGWGDATLMAGLGALLGMSLTIAALYMGLVIGGVCGVFLMLTGKATRKTRLPLAPFLAVGVWLALVLAPLLSPYLGISLDICRAGPVLESLPF